MHVVTVSYEWPGKTTNCGGGGRYGADLVSALRARGHSVTVVTDERDGHFLTFPFRSFSRLRRTIRNEGPDVILGLFSLPTCLFVPHFAREFDVPFVVSVLGADVYDPTRLRWLRPLADRANERIFRSADGVVVPSTDMKHRLHQTFGQASRVIHIGIDPSEWSWRERCVGSPYNVLTVCRLVERKNLDVAYRALRRARDRGLDLRWRLVGAGPMQAELEELTAEDEWVELTGYVDDLQAQHDWGDVFFLPSHYESFGIVFLEALASGLPVVTSGTGGQTDIVDSSVGFAGETTVADGGERESPPATYATMLERLTGDYATHQQSTDGYVAERFHREQMVDEYEEALQEVAR